MPQSPPLSPVPRPVVHRSGLLGLIGLVALAAGTALLGLPEPVLAAKHRPQRLAQASSGLPPAPRVVADNADDARIQDAREAWVKRDRQRLATLRQAVLAQRHPLAPWVDYWDLNLRLGEVGQEEVEAFYARWPGSYVEDRLRNDWLLELGRRRDWRNFAVEQPRFRMADDREVVCYGLVVRHLLGEDVRQSARAAWLAQKDADEGCRAMAQILGAAGVVTPTDVWARIRQAAEFGRPRQARQALDLMVDLPPVAPTAATSTPSAASAEAAPASGGGGAPVASSLQPLPPLPALAFGGALSGLNGQSLATELWEQPTRFLSRRGEAVLKQPGGGELVAIALVRLAVSDAEQAAAQLGERWQPLLRTETATWAWSAIAKHAAMRLSPQAEGWFQRALELAPAAQPRFHWSDDSLAWRIRAALRAPDPGRWLRLLEAVNRMSPVEQTEPAWVYWKARALLGHADPGPTGDGLRIAAHLLLERIAGQPHWYGLLASQQLGRTQALPLPPAPPTEAERQRVADHPGLRRGLAMMALGLVDEGRREWNYTLRELNDRELNAAARLAGEHERWDRAIAAAERSKAEVDLSLRYPQPYRAEILAAAAEAGVDPALVFGLIRQESRFSPTIRSSAGAAGLMQVIVPTARSVAKTLGLRFTPEMLTDRPVNLRLGTTYLRMTLDDFGGSQAMALAGYNAGPGRPRRWREGPMLEVAAWAEGIPFLETRDYVKKVLANAAIYQALLSPPVPAPAPIASASGPAPAPTAPTAPTAAGIDLGPRLQPLIGPRPADAPPENRELP
ncbi:MAG: hypothetical protein RL722_838 [Pseudomonadota bacterium]